MIKAKIYFLNGFLEMGNELDNHTYTLLKNLNIKVSDYFNSNFTELPIVPSIGMGIGIESFLDNNILNNEEKDKIVDLPQFEIKHIQLMNGFVYLDVE